MTVIVAHTAEELTGRDIPDVQADSVKQAREMFNSIREVWGSTRDANGRRHVLIYPDEGTQRIRVWPDGQCTIEDATNQEK